MGQYHKLVNTTLQEVVHPHNIGIGLKQVEQFFSEFSTPHALMILLSRDNFLGGGDFPGTAAIEQVAGRWCGHSVMFVGDYGEQLDHNDYYAESEGWSDISDLISDAFEDLQESYTPLRTRTLRVREND